MKAIRQEKYCKPVDLKIVDIDKPIPKSSEVQIKVHASSVNPYDWHYVRGIPYMMRLTEGLTVPKERTRGGDFSGVVTELGNQVSDFKVGDQVYGFQSGAFAEYLCAPEARLALKPKSFSFVEAASVPLAGVTALQGLLEVGGLSPKEHVMIIGASGGIGTFAVQIAKDIGATVTAVCSTKNIEFVKSLGADTVLDYTKENILKSPTKVDLVFQLGGEQSALSLRKVLTPKGRVVLSSGDSHGKILGPIGRFLVLPFVNPFVSQTLRDVNADPTSNRLKQLAIMIDEGRLKTIINRTYPLDRVADAICYIESRHARAKSVIKIV